MASYVSLVAAKIEGFTIVRSQSGTLPTKLGNTLVIRICAVPGPELNQGLNAVLSAVASLEKDLPGGIEAVAAGLVNCNDPDSDLRIIGVVRETIEAFANQEIEPKDFQREWQPLS